MHKNHLRFNFGFLLEASLGTSSDFEFEYPQLSVEDMEFVPLSGKFRATRTGEGIYVNGTFETKTDVECIRCLETADVPLVGEVKELFFYPPSTAPKGELTIGEDGNLDLGPIIRELAIMAIPMQPVCKDDCRGLCPECGANRNIDQCSCEIDDIDPRLAKLKELLASDGE
ncbi:MAG: DUF177 domain-containing protein [Chloroflexota bacterium]